MVIRNPKDLGLAIRDRRRELRLSQAELAKRVGVTRQWVIGIEQGKRSAEFGLVLKAAAALGLTVDLRGRGQPTQSPGRTSTPPIDIDAIVERAKDSR